MTAAMGDTFQARQEPRADLDKEETLEPKPKEEKNITRTPAVEYQRMPSNVRKFFRRVNKKIYYTRKLNLSLFEIMIRMVLSFISGVFDGTLRLTGVNG